MKDEGKSGTRRRGDAGQDEGFLTLRASAPPRDIWRRIVTLAFGATCLVVSSCMAQVPPVPSSAPPAHSPSSQIQQKGESAWPLGRGNALADGVARTTLPEKPEVVWKVTVEKGAFDGTPVIADGVVYLGDMDGKVYAWKLADGTEIWSYKVESGFIAAPAIRGNLLYIGDMDGKFYALDIKSGKPKWTFDAEAEIDNGANFWKDNVDVRLSRVMHPQIQAINPAIRHLPRIDHSLFRLGCLRRRSFVLFLLVIIRRLDRRQPFQSANAKPIQRPTRCPAVQPRQHNDVARNPAESQEPRSVSLQVVQMRNHHHIDPRLHK